MPMKPALTQPLAGILEPVFAIRTEDDLGIGDTDGVNQMVDWCHHHGLNILQTLPINETGGDNSPYNAISAQAIDPTTIAISPNHLPDLSDEDFRKHATPELLADLRRGPVQFRKVKSLKNTLLNAAFTCFLEKDQARQSPRFQQFRTFVQQHKDWLADYSLFRVLMEHNNDSPSWNHWPVVHRTPKAAREWLQSLSISQREQLLLRQSFFEYVQWIAHTQWLEVRARAASKHVYLMGDIPFGISRASADTWANPDIFDLEWSGGAPPEKTFKVDKFTEMWGQNWGIPLYRWDVLRQRNYAWWRMRVRNTCKIFQFFRIDHVLGFFRIYAFPWTPDRNAEFVDLNETQAAEKTNGLLPGFKPFPDDTDSHKQSNRAQGEELLRIVLAASASQDAVVIAEDLGMVPEYVHPTLQKLLIPGFCIPMFLRGHDGRYADPRKYPALSISQPATHDHPPLAAAWADLWADIDAGHNPENARRELQRIMRFVGLEDEEPPRQFTESVHERYLETVLGGASWLAVFQITDVFAQTERFNVPGSAADTNWSYRLPHTVRQLMQDPHLASKAETFSQLAKKSNRSLS
jgi:4-alpha-glucanotransferase